MIQEIHERSIYTTGMSICVNMYKTISAIFLQSLEITEKNTRTSEMLAYVLFTLITLYFSIKV